MMPLQMQRQTTKGIALTVSNWGLTQDKGGNEQFFKKECFKYDYIYNRGTF